MSFAIAGTFNMFFLFLCDYLPTLGMAQSLLAQSVFGIYSHPLTLMTTHINININFEINIMSSSYMATMVSAQCKVFCIN